MRGTVPILPIGYRIRCQVSPLQLPTLSSTSLRNFRTTAYTSQNPSTASSTASTSVTPSLFSPSRHITKPFFITTPIFYVNASPHIGHLHSLVLSDVLARYSALRNPERKVIFTTGTDEHGSKVQQAAKLQGIPEEEFCANVSQRFRDLADQANIGYTDFIRTSEERHHRAVEHFWERLVQSGDIYKGTHSGWYSVSDECFYAQSQVTETEDGRTVSAETGNEVVWEEEENWKFRLPKFRDQLLEWANLPQSVQPESIRSQVIAQIETIDDLSISRPKSRVKWGVTVPGDPDQTIYVWVDALINYITVLGYPQSMDGWPADVQVVGKDIIRFHAIHWPALLLSAGYTPPQRILAHAHWTMGNSKMSKSKGNVVDPITAMSIYGVDSVRWYLMRGGGSLPDDSDYSDKQLLSNHIILGAKIGNLVARISSVEILKRVQDRFNNSQRQPVLDEKLRLLRGEVERRMEKYEITKACKAIIDVIAEANRFFTRSEPWRQKSDPTTAVLYAYNSLRISAILLLPIMPTKAVELLDRLGVDKNQRRWEDATWNGAHMVDVAHMRKQIIRAAGAWKDKGHLIPKVKAAEKVKVEQAEVDTQVE